MSIFFYLFSFLHLTKNIMIHLMEEVIQTCESRKLIGKTYFFFREVFFVTILYLIKEKIIGNDQKWQELHNVSLNSFSPQFETKSLLFFFKVGKFQVKGSGATNICYRLSGSFTWISETWGKPLFLCFFRFDLELGWLERGWMCLLSSRTTSSKPSINYNKFFSSRNVWLLKMNFIYFGLMHIVSC